MNYLDDFDYYFSEGDFEANLQRQDAIQLKAKQQRQSSSKNLYAIGRFAKVFRNRRRRSMGGTKRRKGRGIRIFHENYNPILFSFLNEISPNHIYVISDLHLFKNPKNTKDLMLSFKQECNKLTDEDVLIILGDVGYKKNSANQNEEIKKYFKSIKCNKILVKGNHDSLPNEFYKKCGFLFIEDKISYDDILFTHKPEDINKYRLEGIKYNIHGHLHGKNEYWDCDGKNHFDVYTKNHKLLNLEYILKHLYK